MSPTGRPYRLLAEGRCPRADVDPRIQRRLPGARLDSGPPRTGRGSLHRIGQHGAVTAWYLLAPETIDESMARLLARKRGVIGAVTDGRPLDDEGLVEAVVRELRGRPYRHPQAVA